MNSIGPSPQAIGAKIRRLCRVALNCRRHRPPGESTANWLCSVSVDLPRRASLLTQVDLPGPRSYGDNRFDIGFISHHHRTYTRSEKHVLRANIIFTSQTYPPTGT